MRGFLLSCLSRSLILRVIASITGFGILNLVAGGPMASRPNWRWRARAAGLRPLDVPSSCRFSAPTIA